MVVFTLHLTEPAGVAFKVVQFATLGFCSVEHQFLLHTEALVNYIDQHGFTFQCEWGINQTSDGLTGSQPIFVGLDLEVLVLSVLPCVLRLVMKLKLSMRCRRYISCLV